MNDLRRRVRAKVLELARAHTSAPRLGVAVGLGVLVGTTPAFGFHAIIGAALAGLLRLNVIATVAGTNISLPFVAPFLVFGSVQVGNWALSGAWLSVTVDELGVERGFELLGTWLLGSLMLGTALGLLAGLSTWLVVRALRS